MTNIGHFRTLLDAAHVALAELVQERESVTADFAASLRRESDWLRAAQATLRQFVWERPGTDSFAKRRSV
jgi:hypothetical protein